MSNCVAPGWDYARTFKGKQSVFQFPTDPVRLRAWLKSVPRQNFAATKHSKMSEIHFEERFISRTTSAIRPDETKAEARLTRPKLTADAIPTLFPSALPVANKNGIFNPDIFKISSIIIIVLLLYYCIIIILQYTELYYSYYYYITLLLLYNMCPLFQTCF